MGLDMNLYGEKSLDYQVEEMIDGFKVSKIVLEIAYWRKHPNLHGFIVSGFADGVDECQRIHLDKDDLHNIIVALKNDAIYGEPVTGFFFGRSYFPGEKDEFGSYEEQKAYDIEVFTKARDWLLTEGKEWRSVVYQASW